MEIEPKTLNIPLHRNGRWGFVLVAAGAFSSAVAWLFSPGLALAFTVSCAVVVPALWLFFFPPHLLRSKLPRLFTYVLMFGYLALAKAAIIPFFVSLFHASAAA